MKGWFFAFKVFDDMSECLTLPWVTWSPVETVWLIYWLKNILYQLDIFL